MSQYYFLTASLPFLLPDSPVILDSAAFLATCESNMEAEDFRLLSGCRLDPAEGGEGHPLLRKWRDWEISLRNELVRLRAQNLKADAEAWLREGGGAAGLTDAVREAAGMASPLEAELRLDRLRWSFLDELESGHIFDLERLMVYFLKLQLLERHLCFSADRGGASYRDIYQSVVSQIQGS